MRLVLVLVSVLVNLKVKVRAKAKQPPYNKLSTLLGSKGWSSCSSYRIQTTYL